MAVPSSTMQRKYQLMHYISVWKFSFGKVYTAFIGNLLYRVSHKNDSLCCFVGKLQKLWNCGIQVADIRRTFSLSTILGKLK